MSNVGEQVSKTVESAKETVAKVGESVSDFFQGNPFSTPVGRKIELATDARNLATENWGLNMEICDFINGYEDGPRDAIRAIKKRLHSNLGKNNAVVMYTLTVLETCVKNCNYRFHLLVCSREFIQDLVKLIEPKFDAPQIILERVLGLIQSWADAFRPDPALQGVVQVYDDLKSKGVLFPAADLDALAPIKTPKRTVFTQPPAAAQQPPPQPHDPMYDVVPMQGQSFTATPEHLTKLRADLDVVNSNIKVFREALADIVPRKETADELQLLNDLNQTCRQMQTRILDLIRYVSNEEVTNELLVVNDAFNNVFEKYERFVANHASEHPAQSSESTQSAQSALNDLLGTDSSRPLGDQLSALKVSSANGSYDAYTANSEPQSSMGIAAAANQKVMSPEEAEAMQEWLEKQGGSSKPATKVDPENDKL